MSWVITGAPGTGDNLLYSQAGTPALDLRFASTKSLTDYVSGQNLVTHTRASSGTFVDSAGVIQTAAVDVPRFDHNPVTGECLGLLVEESRTNLLVRSEEFDNASWVKTRVQAFGSGSVVNAIVAPDGLTTAEKLVEDATASNTHLVNQSVSVANATAHTASVYAKAGERTWLVIFPTVGGINAGAWFNLSTGTLGTVQANVTLARITSVGNGWYRCSITWTTISTSMVVNYAIASVNNSATYTGDGASGIYLWGAQLEAGAFPTSYIPTTDTTVTRSADVASITGSAFSGWYRQDEGTVFAEVATMRNGGRIFMFDDSTADNRWEIRAQNDIPRFNSWSANVMDGNASSGADLGNPLAPFRSAAAIAVNNAAISTNGAAVGSDSSLAMPIAVNRFFIGSFQGIATFANGPIRRITYWPARLLNTTLQQITQ